MPFQLSLRRASLALAPALVAALIAAGPVGLHAQTAAVPAETPTETTAETPAAAPAAPVPASADSVVAVVNGQEVTLGELIIMRADLPEQYQQAPSAQIMEALLSRVAVETALAAQAVEAGLDKTDHARLRAAIDHRSRLAEAQIRTVIEGASTGAALQAAYDARIADFVPVAEIRASHILVSDQALADDLRKQLDDGAAFADLAAEHGTDGTKTQGGDLGWFEQGQMVPEFAEAAFAGEEGAFVGPIQTQFGWHLIHVTGKRDRPAPIFDSLKDELSAELADAAAQVAITAARDSAVITHPDAQPDAEALRQDGLINNK
ncbi:MAG: peptidyl-prolyl cis-trans isomerase C [Paracoccaceae bacterium]|jgi:peptidyl-prolyl cis-trans isomerase C